MIDLPPHDRNGGTPRICECCGQPNGRCPGCGLMHSPALGVRACEECCEDDSYRSGPEDGGPPGEPRG